MRQDFVRWMRVGNRKRWTQWHRVKDDGQTRERTLCGIPLPFRAANFEWADKAEGICNRCAA